MEEITVGQELPLPPESLLSKGVAKWYSLITILIGRGQWTPDWEPSLEHLCQQYDFLDQIDRVIKEAESKPDGFPMCVYTSKGQGSNIKINPVLEYRLDIVKFIRMSLNDFRLTPKSFIPIRSDHPGEEEERQVSLPTRPRLSNWKPDEDTEVA